MRLVIVDDSQELRFLYRHIFETAGHRVVGEASNGAEAVLVARRKHPNVILMDVSMPILGGIEALIVLKMQAPDVLVIIMSASYDCSRQANELGAGFIEKDGDPTALVEGVVRMFTEGVVPLKRAEP